MKKALSVDARGLVAGDSIHETPHQSFDVTITNFARVAYGMKTAEFTLEVTGLGDLQLDAFSPLGKPTFVRPRAICDKYTKQWIRTFALDDDLLAEILKAVTARLEADSNE